jgi:hypothetical protein
VGAVVNFDYDYWQRTYPEFNYLGEDQVLPYWDLAQQVHDNTACGPVNDPASQQRLLNLVTAHIVKLFGPGPEDQAGNVQPAQEVVGRISSAGEGSVNIQTQNDYPPGSAQWYQQTKYGSMYWLGSAPYRSFRYVRRPFTRPSMGPPWQYPNNSNWPW